MNSSAFVAGVILAGGRSVRMGGEFKGATMLSGTPLLQHVYNRFVDQVDLLLLNINGDPGFALGAPVIAVEDCIEGYPGPLTGLLSGFEYLAQSGIQANYVAVAPCDGPFLPDDLVLRLKQALCAKGASVACARYNSVLQPTFSLWKWSTYNAVKNKLLSDKYGGFKELLRELPAVYVDWPKGEIDPFFNINSPQDLQLGERLLESGQ